MSPVPGRWPGASRRTAGMRCDVAKPRDYRRTPGTPLRGGSLPPAFGGHTHPEAGPDEKVGNEIQRILRGRPELEAGQTRPRRACSGRTSAGPDLAGLLAWQVEKDRAWSDVAGPSAPARSPGTPIMPRGGRGDAVR